MLSTTSRAPASWVTRGDGLDVGDAEQRVGRGLDPHHPGLGAHRRTHRLDVGDGGDRVLHPPGPRDLVEQAVGAAVGVGRDDDVVAGREQRAQHGILAGEAAGEREAALTALQRRDALLERGAGGVGGAGVLVAAAQARRCRPACRCSPGGSGGRRRRSWGPAPARHGWRGRRSRGARESWATAYAGPAALPTPGRPPVRRRPAAASPTLADPGSVRTRWEGLGWGVRPTPDRGRGGRPAEPVRPARWPVGQGAVTASGWSPRVDVDPAGLAPGLPSSCVVRGTGGHGRLSGPPRARFHRRSRRRHPSRTPVRSPSTSPSGSGCVPRGPSRLRRVRRPAPWAVVLHFLDGPGSCGVVSLGKDRGPFLYRFFTFSPSTSSLRSGRTADSSASDPTDRPG